MSYFYELINITILVSFLASLLSIVVLGSTITESQLELSTEERVKTFNKKQRFIQTIGALSLSVFFVTGTVGLAILIVRAVNAIHP